MIFANIFGFLMGLVIGWNLPQPKWVKDIQQKILDKFNDPKI